MTKTYENALKEAFPEIDAGIQPFGSRVLVQIRTAKKKTAFSHTKGEEAGAHHYLSRWQLQSLPVLQLRGFEARHTEFRSVSQMPQTKLWSKQPHCG